MATPVCSVRELLAPGFPENHANDKGDCIVEFSKGEPVVMPIRLALLNGIFWSVYDKFGVEVTKDKIFWIDSFTEETTNKCCTKIYRDLVLTYRVPNYMDVLSDIWLAINRIFRFICKNCREYQVSMDAWALDRLCMQPPMVEVCTRPINEKLGTLIAEQQHTQISDDLHKILQTPGLLKENCLAPLMKTKLLKRNQLPQMFCAYGPRSDIDDTMLSHVINANAFTGLENVQDFATEYLSAKKAQYFNTGVIRKAQYFARRMRLGASRMPKFYPNSCGSTVTLPIVIKPEYKDNFIGKYIKVTKEDFDKYDDDKIHLFDDSSIMLTKKNLDHFVGTEVNMWSPFGCRYTDGVCEHCAGFMNQHVIAFVPPEIQAGVYGATKLSAVVTQKILSSKHLIKTTSKEFNLSQHALKYFSKNSDALFWQAAVVRDVKKCYARVDVKDIGPTSDLNNALVPAGEAWSHVDRIQLVGANGNIVDDIGVTDWTIHPHFSNYVMTFMKEHYKDLRIRSEYIDIPLKDYDFRKPFLLFTAVNDDMVSYVNEVDKFLCSKIRDYHSIIDCINDFAAVVYRKSNISIFYIEQMLRAFLITQSGKDHLIPVITDPHQAVEFDRMSSMISESSLSTKLSYERLLELFESPDATLYNRGDGYGFNDYLFGFCSAD